MPHATVLRRRRPTAASMCRFLRRSVLSAGSWAAFCSSSRRKRFSAGSCPGLFSSRRRSSRAAISCLPTVKNSSSIETGIFAVQGLVAIYGGYFGGGIGILMLSALTLFGLRDIWLMNSLKILLVTLMNAAAVDDLHDCRSRSLAMDDRCRHWRDCGRLCRIACGAAGAGDISSKVSLSRSALS